MNKVNVIIVFDTNIKRLLMCYRSKDPYKGLYNLVGGKVEKNESWLESAYRELYEETMISKDDIELKYLMGFDYPLDHTKLQVYVGRLNKEVEVKDEVNKLYWMDINENFFDMNKFAGEGNIGHMLEIVKLFKEELL